MAKMRLSEAILAGSTLIHPKRGFTFVTSVTGAKSGCALGMAGVAIGAMGLYQITDMLDSEFPVLREVVSLPCCCEVKKNNFQYKMNGAIMHLFDHHVMSTVNTWTLEQLVDWVRQIEDTEENDPLTTKKEEFAEMLQVLSV